MSVSSRVRLDGLFPISPEQMIGVGQRLPVMADFYVPIGMFRVKFDLRTPSIQACGEGAVRMALDQPFGFMTSMTEISNTLVRSQQTDGLIFAPAGAEAGAWDAIVTTGDYLTDADQRVFSFGAEFFARAVADKLHLRAQAGLGPKAPLPQRRPL